MSSVRFTFEGRIEPHCEGIGQLRVYFRMDAKLKLPHRDKERSLTGRQVFFTAAVLPRYLKNFKKTWREICGEADIETAEQEAETDAELRAIRDLHHNIGQFSDAIKAYQARVA